MKNLVFVNPPMSLQERYGRLAAAGSVMPPLGLCSLAAVCRLNGFGVSIVDAACGGMSHEATFKAVCAANPAYVGITAMTAGINSAAKIASEVKKKNPSIQTLIGGPHITALPLETMRLFPDFDIGFIGEAEETIVEYLKATSAGDPLENVKGLVFRKNGAVVQSGARPFIEDLNSLPLPAWDLLPGFPGNYIPAAIRCKQLPASHLVASRGCPMKCTFCDRSVFGNRYRLFSIDYVFSMIQILHDKFGIRDILFEDDSFTLNKRRVTELCERIVNARLGISWSCLGRVDSIDETLLKTMKRAGCWQIGFGIESGNAGILDNVHKSINLDRIRDALALTRKAHIRTKGFFVLGLPGETSESMSETIRFAKSIALDDISVSFCTPFPGTVLNEQAAESGAFDPDWSKMNLMNAVFVPKGMTKEQLEAYHSRFLREFYFRVRVVGDYLSRCVTAPSMALRLIRILVSSSGLAFWAGKRKTDK